MDSIELKKAINDIGFAKALKENLSISEKKIPEQTKRYSEAVDRFTEIYGDGDLSVFSVGGRSEISGNHTDHNHGKVIAACINLDILAIAKKSMTGTVRIKSEGFPEDIVYAGAVEKSDPNKYYKSESIIAGMEKALKACEEKIEKLEKEIAEVEASLAEKNDMQLVERYTQLQQQLDEAMKEWEKLME